MVSQPPYSLVLTYTDDPQKLIMRVVDSARLAALVAKDMEVSFFLDGDEFKFDDELARQLGVAVLNVIAKGRPAIKACLSVTQHPIGRL